MAQLIDLIGQRFGRLVVFNRANSNKHGQVMWLCKCDCGEAKIIRADILKSGRIKSCGCLKHNHAKKNAKTKTYHAWISMTQRCSDPKQKSYHYYGGRGIQVCKRWRKFVNFLEDMGEAPEGYQIDRIDNDKGYSKSNCHWTTRKQQSRNKRNSVFITHENKTQLLIEWAEELKITYQTLYKRLKRGWSVEKTLTTPVANQFGTWLE